MHMGTAATQSVAAEVRAAIARKGFTASHVASGANITNSTMSLRLRGVSPFTVDELARIAAVLDVEIQDLLPHRQDRREAA